VRPRRPTRRPLLWVALVSLVAAACSDAPAGPDSDDVLPFGTVQGKIVAPGITTFGDVTARVTWGERSYTAPVRSNGSFVVDIEEAVLGFGTLTIEPAAAEPIHPGWVLLTPGDVEGGQGTVVLSPRSWTPETGDYAGIEIPIDPELAADARVMPSFWGFYFPFEQQGFLQTVTDNTAWAGEFRSWAPNSYPIPVALDHVGTQAELTAADSIAFWAHADRMEQALGWDVFRPARIEELRILSGTRRAAGAILVRVDTTLTTRGVGQISRPEPKTWGLTADARSWSGGRVQNIDMTSADITYGLVKVDASDALQDQRLVIHELMHILGAGHGCSWASVQTYCASLATDVPTAADVGHLTVFLRMRELEIEHGARWGILAAVLGHRVVTLGLPPVPELNLVYGPASTPADWRRP